MCGQSLAADNQATFLVGAENIERVNPAVTRVDYALDGVTSAQDLIGKASYHSRKFAPTFTAKFASHTAKPYIPFHSGENHATAHA
jgi:hypothetical protein